jgi:hypothetical protein
VTFNGDGMADFLWRDNLGNASIWLMNGATVLLAGGWAISRPRGRFSF